MRLSEQLEDVLAKYGHLKRGGCHTTSSAVKSSLLKQLRSGEQNSRIPSQSQTKYFV